jgi:hypothetical protein
MPDHGSPRGCSAELLTKNGGPVGTMIVVSVGTVDLRPGVPR